MAIYKLEELFEIKRGEIISNDYISQNIGIYPVISSQTKNNGIYGYINSFMYDGQYITMSADGAYAGTPFLQKGKFSITNVCFIFLPKEETKNTYNTRYIFYLLLKNKENNRKSSLVGSSRPAIRGYSLKKWELKIPNLEEQQKIIDIIEPNESLFLRYSKLVNFSNLDSVANSMKKIIDIIEPLEKQINVLKLSIEQQVNKIDFYQKYLFKNISNFKKYKLKDVFSSKPQYGTAEPSSNIEYDDSVKYLTQSDLKTPIDELNKFIKITTKNSNCFLNKGDFLISRAGTIESYLFDSDEKVIFAGYLIRYNFKSDILLNKYIFYWTKKNKNFLDRISQTGSVMRKLNANEVANISINIPSLEEQQKIISIIEPLYTFINSQEYKKTRTFVLVFLC